MPLVGAALDQAGQRILFQSERVPVRQPLRPGEGRGQRQRNDEVAKAQSPPWFRSPRGYSPLGEERHELPRYDVRTATRA